MVLCLLVSLLSGCRGASVGSTVTLNVFNWGEYIDDEVLMLTALFTEETGIRINYKT